MKYVEDIRNEFRRLADNAQDTNGTYEIRNALFIVDSPTIFGKRNEEYIEAEIKWYHKQSLNVNDLFDIYGQEVQIWKDVADKHGNINSNYGWCIFSEANGSQYSNVVGKLLQDYKTRQAQMIYSRPTMHRDAVSFNRKDFMCTNYVQYYVKAEYLHATVHMRSNDAIFGFINDYAWQKHVLSLVADAVDLKIGPITWFADSLHIYRRHWDLIR